MNYTARNLSINWTDFFPPLINDKNTIEQLKKSAEKYLEPENIFFGGYPTMGGDFFIFDACCE